MHSGGSTAVVGLTPFPEKSSNIPSHPDRVYKKDWHGWGDWVGTGNIKNGGRKYRSFVEARRFVLDLHLNEVENWYKYCRGEIKNLPSKPDDIPRKPERVYAKEWKGMPDWIGKDYQYQKIGCRLNKRESMFDLSI